MNRLTRLMMVVLPASLGLGACSDDFDPYNELLDFRVLGIRASAPFLGPNETTTLDALTYLPSDAPITWSWTWCPISAGAEKEYECAVTEAQLQEAVDRVAGQGAVTVPPFALSTTSTASFTYSVPPALFTGLCDALKQIPLPSYVPELKCSSYFPVQIRLVATSGGKRIIAFKELRMLYDGAAPRNQNPTFGELSYREKGQARTAAKVIDPASPPTLKRNTTYVLSADISESASESYVKPADATSPEPTNEREVLVTTWFVTGGETDDTRTTFIAGEIPIADAGENEWTTPKVVDYAKDRATLILVIRDGRDGIGWLVRDVLLGE